MVGAVGDVVVDVEVGVQGGDQPRHGLGLGADQTQEIAVEVDAVGGGAIAHALDRTILVRAVVGRHILVSVGVVDRCEDGDRALGQFRPAAEGDVAQDHQGRLLAVDLAGVDAALDEQDRFAGGLVSAGAEGAVRGHDDQRQTDTRPRRPKSIPGSARVPLRRAWSGTIVWS